MAIQNMIISHRVFLYLRLYSIKCWIHTVTVSLLILLIFPTHVSSQDTTGLEFGAYMLSGFGIDGKGGPHDVFMAPQSEAKYRLGNEAEAYIEALFRYAFEDERHTLFETNLRLAFVTPTSKSNEFLTTTSVREAYIKARGTVQKLPRLAFWAGQRFYDRHDVHINDYFYRDMSGFGGGFEDLAIGDVAKISMAFLGGSIDELASNGSVQPINHFVLNKTTLDLSIYNLDLPVGQLGFTFTISNFHGDSIETTDGTYHVKSNTGWSGGMFYDLPFQGGRNRLNIFYGIGAAENYKAVITQPSGIILIPGETIEVGGFNRLRVINDLQCDLSSAFSLLGLVMYQRLENSQPLFNRLDWFSAGIRPVYHFNRYLSLLVEIGMDHTDQEGVDKGTLMKLTVAPQISPLNKILSRPAIRAYFTYAHWSDSWIGQVATGSFSDQDHGISAGIQMEVWW